MRFDFRPGKASHTIGIDNDCSPAFSRRNIFCVDLTVDDVPDVFELGDSYVICSSFTHQRHYKNKVLVTVSCSFMPASWLTHDARVRFNLSELAIGYGRFSVGKKFSISIEPAYLAFKIYVPDEDTMSSLQSSIWEKYLSL